METTKTIRMCYGSLSLFTSLLHNIFLLYHVETFISIYQIDVKSFWVAEMIFLIWNSINDPLFGWLSDSSYLQNNYHSSSSVILLRVNILSYSGPLLALAFLTFWFQWLPAFLQLVICLCTYDGFLTMVDLHHSALLADLAISSDARTKLIGYNSMFNALGSLSVFLSYLYWNEFNMVSFRSFCIILTVISFLGFSIVCDYMKRYTLKKHSLKSFHAEINKDDRSNMNLQSSLMKVKIFASQLGKHRNFKLFAVANFLQVFHCHFNSNFFPLFLDVLLEGKVSPTFSSMLLGISFLAPHLNNLYFISLCRKYGTYNIIAVFFLVKVLLGLIMNYMGADYHILLCIFIASNRIFTEGTCKLMNLIISDLVDEDYVMHSRKHAVSALLFGTCSLIAKPGQTLAPVLGIYLLASITGKHVFHEANHSVRFGNGSGEIERQACFFLLLFVPIICGACQLFLWSQYTLTGERLKWVKHARQQGSNHASDV